MKPASKTDPAPVLQTQNNTASTEDSTVQCSLSPQTLSIGLNGGLFSELRGSAMANCCTNIAVGSGGLSFVSTLPSNGRPQPSPSMLFCCRCSEVSKRRSWGITKESRAPPRSRSWTQQRLTLQPRTESTSSSSCLPTDVSSDAISPDSNVVESSGSGMSIEEKDAILAFEGLSPDGTAEEGNSSEYQVKGIQFRKQSEDDTDLQGRYETGSKAVKGQGATIANVVTLFMTLLDRPSPGDGKLIAGAGNAVLELVEEEVGKLQAVEGVDGQSLYEIRRLVKLLMMDIQLISATRKDSTLSERLTHAKTHCRQILNIVSSLSG